MRLLLFPPACPCIVFAVSYTRMLECPYCDHPVIVSPQPRLVRRPLDPRLEEDGLYLLVRRLGVDLFIKLFSSALLERKILLYSAHLGSVSWREGGGGREKEFCCVIVYVYSYMS